MVEKVCGTRQLGRKMKKEDLTADQRNRKRSYEKCSMVMQFVEEVADE
jgi:hypothetical protein